MSLFQSFIFNDAVNTIYGHTDKRNILTNPLTEINPIWITILVTVTSILDDKMAPTKLQRFYSMWNLSV